MATKSLVVVPLLRVSSVQGRFYSSVLSSYSADFLGMSGRTAFLDVAGARQFVSWASGCHTRIRCSAFSPPGVIGSSCGGRIPISNLDGDFAGSEWRRFRGGFSSAVHKWMNVRGDRDYIVRKTRRGGARAGSGRALQLMGASKGEGVEVEEGREQMVEVDDEWRSRNQSKRDSKRAREWGVELASLPPAQIKQAIRWAGLSDDVYDAVMIVKNLGTSSRVRNGRRRQYSYIGGLLRDVDPDVMEPVLKATRDGDVEGIIVNSPVLPNPADEEYDESWDEEDEEEEDTPKLVAEEWLQGFVCGDSAIEEEVYSIYDADYDRQELRKLVRNVKMSTANESSTPLEQNKADEVGSVAPSAAQIGAQEKLRQFLVNIAIQRVENGV